MKSKNKIKKDNECIGEVLGSKTKFKKNQILNLRKKESFQFVPETANGKFRVVQVVRKRVPKCGRGMKEPAGANCLRSRSRDDKKTLLEPG